MCIRDRTHPVPPGWWGFEDPELDAMFSSSEGDDVVVGEMIATYADSAEALGHVTTEGDTTTIRVVAHLDRGGDPCVAKAFAALVDAAQARAEGRLRLVNDGTYSGEDGVSVLVGGGALKRERVEDCNELVEELGMQIYGELES